MKKLSTLFKKDPNDLGRVINEVNTFNQWVYDGFGIPTRKFDGTACMIFRGELYKRYDCKINIKTGEYKRIPPLDAIPCQSPDFLSGHHPHWIKCDRSNPADKYHFEAFDSDYFLTMDGTFELCGPKVQGNPERYEEHILIRHGAHELNIGEYDFDTIRKYLEITDIEGIVFHHSEDDRMCKIRKSDFGIKR